MQKIHKIIKNEWSEQKTTKQLFTITEKLGVLNEIVRLKVKKKKIEDVPNPWLNDEASSLSDIVDTIIITNLYKFKKHLKKNQCNEEL